MNVALFLQQQKHWFTSEMKVKEKTNSSQECKEYTEPIIL